MESNSSRDQKKAETNSATITSDVGQNTVFGEDVNEEKLGKTPGVDVFVTRNKNNLFGGAITNNQDDTIFSGGWKLFNEVHGD
jgi:hypothetical protein